MVAAAVITVMVTQLSLRPHRPAQQAILTVTMVLSKTLILPSLVKVNVVDCCVGNQACLSFTGKVCKDGKSCMGDFACWQAKIPSGVVNSCKGSYACKEAGSTGVVGRLVNSCHGEKACDFLGGSSGTIGDVYDSCIGKYSCKFGAYTNAIVGNVTMSCTGENACYKVGWKGTVGNMVNSCTGTSACAQFAFMGKAGALQDSCVGDYSCKEAGTFSGSIGDMAMSCNSYKACFQAGTTAAGAIISNLNTCCSTGAEVCKKATEATLPADCHPDVSTVNRMRSVVC